MMTMLSVSACELAADAGPCEDFADKWFFDVQTKRCEQFTYGGCEGNENRFSSKAECERTCVRERKLQQQGAQKNSKLLKQSFTRHLFNTIYGRLHERHLNLSNT